MYMKVAFSQINRGNKTDVNSNTSIGTQRLRFPAMSVRYCLCFIGKKVNALQTQCCVRDMGSGVRRVDVRCMRWGGPSVARPTHPH